MNAEQTLKNAAHNGVALAVPKDRDVIVATPKGRVTRELAEGIRSNKEELLRDVLMRQALDFLDERWAKGAETGALRDAEKKLNDAFDRPLPKYREAVRAYVEAGLAEIRRARNEEKRGAA